MNVFAVEYRQLINNSHALHIVAYGFFLGEQVQMTLVQYFKTRHVALVYARALDTIGSTVRVGLMVVVAVDPVIIIIIIIRVISILNKVATLQIAFHYLKHRRRQQQL